MTEAARRAVDQAWLAILRERHPEVTWTLRPRRPLDPPKVEAVASLGPLTCPHCGARLTPEEVTIETRAKRRAARSDVTRRVRLAVCQVCGYRETMAAREDA